MRLRVLLIAMICALFAAPTRAATLGIDGARFTIDGKPTFLLGFSYYGGLAVGEEQLARDLDDIRRAGGNWIRVWADWFAFANDVSAIDDDGARREPYFGRLEKLLTECDRRGIVVDVTIARDKLPGGAIRLKTPEQYRRAVETLVEGLKAHRNWYLDLGNERNVRDQRFVSFENLAMLRARARELDPARLVTASHSSDDDDLVAELPHYLNEVKVDFITQHRPRGKQSPSQTADATGRYLAAMRKLGRVVPLHYQEPFRRDYGAWQPAAADFLTDLAGARQGGAAGWCFHNGAPRNGAAGKRRSFDLREGPLFEHFDEVERDVASKLKAAAFDGP